MPHTTIGAALQSGRHHALRTAVAVVCAGAVFAPSAQAFNPQPDPPGRNPELRAQSVSREIAPTIHVTTSSQHR